MMKSYDLNLTYAKKMHLMFLNLCTIQSEVLCTLVTTEAKIQIISHSIPELNEKILARIDRFRFFVGKPSSTIKIFRG